MARANRRAEHLQKQKLRRLDWDEEPDAEPEDIEIAAEDGESEDAEDDETGRSG